MLRITFLAAFLFLFNSFFAQQISDADILNFNGKDLKLTRKEETDAGLLASALTKDRTGDKEKFDAIFYWVASNIKYNYREYYSSGAEVPSIAKILSSKQAICLGYANLMDTLCHLAGLTGKTVFGYSKDELFDVGDSLFLDNHAWNAVRLDGGWYVYDVTWSAGYKGYKLTGFSKKVLAWQKKYKFKYKKKKLQAKNFNTNCGNEYKGDAYIYKSKGFNRWWGKILFSLPVKTTPDYVPKLNPDFYLTQPEVFAITHVPDDPRWTLVNPKKLREYESDSAFYYVDEDTYKKQQRVSKSCRECDDFIAMSEVVQNKNLKEKSRQFNPRNQFIVAQCEIMDCLYKLRDSESASEDKVKLKWIDSAEISLKNTKKCLQEGKKNLTSEYKMQKTKNKEKLTLLKAENKVHTAFMKQKVTQSSKQTKNIRKLGESMVKFSHENKANADEIRLIVIEESEKIKPNKKTADIELKVSKAQRQIDSLTPMIANRKHQIDSLLDILTEHVWKQAFAHDTMAIPFYYGKKLREHLEDNYKKVLADIRKQIPVQQNKYEKELNSLVYIPSEKSLNLFLEIEQLSKARDKLQKANVISKKELAKAEAITYDEFETYRVNVINERHFDYCWLANNAPKISASYTGMDFLKIKQEVTGHFINLETDAEKDRHSQVETELKRRLKKYNNITSENLSTLKKGTKEVADYKKIVTKRMKGK